LLKRYGEIFDQLPAIQPILLNEPLCDYQMVVHPGEKIVESEAANQLYGETGNWLSRGRKCLAHNLLNRYPPPPGDCLEIGAGAGFFLELLKSHGSLDVIEINPVAIAKLKQRTDVVRTVYDIGLPELETGRRYSLIAGFDVIEHIKDDYGTLRWIANHTLPGAIIILTAPAYQWMFSDHDVANRHFRRYTHTSLMDILPDDEIEPLSVGYFNSTLFPLAILSRLVWMLKKNLYPLPEDRQSIKKQSSNVPGGIDKLFYRILQMESRVATSGVRLPFGLSVFCVARRRP